MRDFCLRQKKALKNYLFWCQPCQARQYAVVLWRFGRAVLAIQTRRHWFARGSQSSSMALTGQTAAGRRYDAEAVLDQAQMQLGRNALMPALAAFEPLGHVDVPGLSQGAIVLEVMPADSAIFSACSNGVGGPEDSITLPSGPAAKMVVCFGSKRMTCV